MELFSGSFDTTNALSGMFLWLIFSYLSTLLNCDLQRMLRHNPLWIHFFGVVAFFFLFTLLDSNNKTDIWIVWAKTVLLYVLFVLMTKSKWYFVLPVIVLLLMDQTIKKSIALREAREERPLDDMRAFQRTVTTVVNVLIVGLVLVGFAQYAYLQKLEYQERFSVYKLLFAVNHACKDT